MLIPPPLIHETLTLASEPLSYLPVFFLSAVHGISSMHEPVPRHLARLATPYRPIEIAAVNRVIEVIAIQQRVESFPQRQSFFLVPFHHAAPCRRCRLENNQMPSLRRSGAVTTFMSLPIRTVSKCPVSPNRMRRPSRDRTPHRQSAKSARPA